MDLAAALKSFANDMQSLRHSREVVSGEAMLSIPGLEKPLLGGAVNLSLGGVGVLFDSTAPDLVAGKDVKITLRWSDGDQVEAEAQIAWQGPKDSEGASYGLVFKNLDETHIDHINRHLITRVVNRHLSNE